MFEIIIKASQSDSRLAALVEEAREYAQVYLLAKQRHKGCAGTGELMTLKEEFKDTVDHMVRYSRECNYLADICSYEIETAADCLLRR